MIYPIGSIYISITDELPSSLGGNGKRNWELLATGTTIWNVSDSSKLGDTIEAGLPDITGQFNGVCAPTISTGCFGVTSDTKGAEHGASNGGIMFKASRSNQIYGKSDTVQPPAVGVHMWKRMS